MSSPTLEFPGVAGSTDRVRGWGARPPLAKLRSGALATVGVAAVLLALVAVAAHLRLRALGAHFWIDEAISTGIASHHLTAIPGLLRQDGAPPLYYVLLHFWIQLFGTSESSVHSLSAIFAIVGVPASYWAVSRPFGRLTGLLAAALAAFNPFLGDYADEGRMYSLLYLESVLVIGLFARAFILRDRRFLPGFSVALALMLYTHNWGFFFAAFAGLAFVVLLVRDYSRARLIDGLLAFGGAALLFLPWLPTLLYQTAHTGAPWSRAPLVRSLPNSATTLLNGGGPEFLLGVTAFAGLWWMVLTGPRDQRRTMLTIVLLGVGTILFGWAYSRWGTPAWAVRYLTIVLGPLLLALAIGLGRLKWVGVLVLSVVAVAYWYGRPHLGTLEHKSNVARVAQYMDARLRPDAVVFSTQPEQVTEINYYLRRADARYYTPLGRVADVGVMDWRDALPRLYRARFASVMRPIVRSLPRGGELLMINPVFFRPTAKWTRHIRFLVRHWRPALRHDPALRVVATYNPSRGYNRATVSAVLYAKR